MSSIKPTLKQWSNLLIKFLLTHNQADQSIPFRWRQCHQARTSMKLSLLCLTRSQKLQPSEVLEVAEEEAEAAETVVVEVVGQRQDSLVIQVPSIQIFQLETGRGVGCTSNTDEVHTFVLSHPLALGRMCLWPNLPSNERLTSSASNLI